jgi:hypothetical protein
MSVMMPELKRRWSPQVRTPRSSFDFSRFYSWKWICGQMRERERETFFCNLISSQVT